MTAIIVSPEKPITFVKDSHALTKPLKKLLKVSEAAIAALEAGLQSQDEKVRVACADKLLGHLEAMSKEVNSDQITRLIAEIKFNRAPMLPDGESEGNSAKVIPTVDFTTVQTV